ncbi:MAG: DUF4870 domain-containing protein [Acidobacteriota bacterium]|nr:DUF4870 domain-containing protein [Acidobacteriota bacterium]
MPFCATCGQPLTKTATFCSECGSPASSSSSPAGGGAAAAGLDALTASSTRSAGAVAYLLTIITGLYFLLSERYRSDRFVRFHALQAILFFLAASALWVAYWVGSSLLRMVSFGFSFPVTYLASFILALALIAYWLFLIYKAYQGETYKIPRLGDFAESIAQSGELSPNVAGALTYSLGFITGIVFLLNDRYKRDRFVRFHAYQSIFASIAYIIIVVILSAVMGAMFLSGLGAFWNVFVLAFLTFRAAVCVGWFYLMWEAYLGKRVAIPGIDGLAAKQAV